MNTNFIVYLIGYILVIAGVWYGLSQTSAINQTWTVVIVLIMAGLGIIYAFSRSQSDVARKESARERQGTVAARNRAGAPRRKAAPRRDARRHEHARPTPRTSPTARNFGRRAGYQRAALLFSAVTLFSLNS